jgi:polysaccharide chain length determinant protein (PEP-CTERM system associated)
MEEARFHPLDYLSVVRRRKWWFIVPALAALLVGAALALLLPKQYLSTATVGIAAPTVTADVAKPATLDWDERIRALSQQLLSRQVLARVVRAEGLDAGDAGLDGAIGRLRAGIQPVTFPTPVAPSPNGQQRLDLFYVSYVDRSPEAAQRITNRLAEAFVDETSRTRAARAEDTTVFLDAQLREAQARLNDTEARLREAKQANMGRLPEQTSANLQSLNGLRQQLESTNIALRGEQDRLSMIERQIEAMQQGAEALPLLRGDVPSTPQVRVQTLEGQLAQARMAYTEKHPEVVRLHEELKAAQAEAAAERTRPAEDRLAYLKNDPAYRQLLADRENGRLRVRELQRAESQARAQIGLYQTRVESAPMVEQQMLALQREYDLQKAQYADLVARRDAARMTESLERRQAGEQFRVFAPASWPGSPYKPDRLRIFLMALMAGGFLGGLGVVGREFLDRSVHDSVTLAREYELPVLGEIPRIQPG